ncbi:MAG: DUF971 domain-containing protein [Myxococcota bacterium]
MDAPEPIAMRLNESADVLTVEFEDGASFELSAEYLRVCSPSAEVQGHGHGQATLQTGKKNVKIKRVDPVGEYAVSIRFDDAHSTGIYTWDYLYALGGEYDTRWKEYLEELAKAGASRE